MILINDDDADDIYIYYDEVCVCLSVTKNDHFRTEHRRCKARRPFWPGDDDDDVDDDVDADDDVDGDDDDVDDDDVDDDDEDVDD